jgi:hypothetical protein
VSPAPRFGGVPDKLRHGDWLLVHWVATAKRGDPFPEPWCHAHSPLTSMIAHLVALDVIERPGPDADVPSIAREATAAAQRWLETHPEPERRPEPPHRGMRWGANRQPWDR